MHTVMLHVPGFSVYAGIGRLKADDVIPCGNGFPFHKIGQVFHIELNLQADLFLPVHNTDKGILLLVCLKIVDKHILRFLRLRRLHPIIPILMAFCFRISRRYFSGGNQKPGILIQEGITHIYVIQEHQGLSPVSLVGNLVRHRKGLLPVTGLNGSAKNHIFSEKLRLAHLSLYPQNVLPVLPEGISAQMLSRSGADAAMHRVILPLKA
ncbi:hypothetical protein IMSAGC007_03593 [Lachnospiraceae bacterium]|nr:hypothetical protein IMSAGC007_03593 [Lachnospiraceae bacterium]